MTRRSRKTTGHLSGSGQILEENTWIADAKYEITILQEYLHPRTFGGDQEPVEGHKIINGTILVNKGEKDLVQGKVLTLVLDDGLRWDFMGKTGDSLKGQCKAIGAGGKGIYTPK